MSFHILGAFWLFIDCAVPFAVLLVISGCSTEESTGPQAKSRVGRAPALHPEGPASLFRAECRPPPRPCPDSCLRFYCRRSLPYMEVGLPACTGERLQQEAWSLPADGHPLVRIFKMYLLKKTRDLFTHVCQKENLGISAEVRQQEWRCSSRALRAQP